MSYLEEDDVKDDVKIESTIRLDSATCSSMFMQFTGCDQLVQRFYFLFTRKCNRLSETIADNMRNAICADTQTSNGVTLLFILFTLIKWRQNCVS